MSRASVLASPVTRGIALRVTAPARGSTAWTLTGCALGQKPIVKVEGVSLVTVKDLKAKLNNIPEEASVEIVMCANDNPLSDGCRVNSVCYFEWLQKDGGKTVVLFPE